MGLMLAVGMVVDNAIVVVETIYRRRSEGAGVREAAISGSAEVNLAIVLSTATTMVVFLPLILMSGEAEISFYRRLGHARYFHLVGLALCRFDFCAPCHALHQRCEHKRRPALDEVDACPVSSGIEMGIKPAI